MFIGHLEKVRNKYVTAPGTIIQQLGSNCFFKNHLNVKVNNEMI